MSFIPVIISHRCWLYCVVITVCSYNYISLMLIAMCSNDVESFLCFLLCHYLFLCVCAISHYSWWRSTEHNVLQQLLSTCYDELSKQNKNTHQSFVSDVQCTSAYISTGCAFLIWSCCSSIFFQQTCMYTGTWD